VGKDIPTSIAKSSGLLSSNALIERFQKSYS